MQGGLARVDLVDLNRRLRCDMHSPRAYARPPKPIRNPNSAHTMAFTLRSSQYEKGYAKFNGLRLRDRAHALLRTEFGPPTARAGRRWFTTVRWRRSWDFWRRQRRWAAPAVTNLGSNSPTKNLKPNRPKVAS